MKKLLLTGLLCIAPVQAGGIYRYTSNHAQAESISIQEKYEQQKLNLSLNSQLYRQKYQLDKLKRRYKATKRYKKATSNLVRSKGRYESSDLALLQAEKEVWDTGLNTKMVKRFDLSGEYTHIKRR